MLRWALGGLCGLLLLSTACEPPGKPEPELSSQDVTDFKVLYSDNCAGCHGIDGKNGPGRILNDPLYLAVLPKQTLKQILIYGRAGTAMPAWAKEQGGPLTMPQIDALVDGMEKNWAKPAGFQGTQLPAYSAADKQGEGDVGRKLFLRNCFMCHGPGAKIGSVTDPSYLSLVSNQMLRTSIIVGRPDLGMPDYRALKLGKPLSDDEITDLVAFLVSKRPVDETTAKLNENSMPGPAGTSGNEGEQRAVGNGDVNDAGTGQSGATSKGNEGSGNGPGSPRKQRGEGNKSTGASSQQGIK